MKKFLLILCCALVTMVFSACGAKHDATAKSAANDANNVKHKRMHGLRNLNTSGEQGATQEGAAQGGSQ